MALRRNFIDFSETMTAINSRLDKGIAVPPWQQATLTKWFDFVVRVIDWHHKHEEGKY